MDMTKLKEEIRSQAFTYKKALTTGHLINQEKERMKTLMLNYLDEIVTAIELAESSQETISRLNAEIDSADEELKELDREIRRLKGQAVSEKDDRENTVSVGEILKKEAGAREVDESVGGKQKGAAPQAKNTGKTPGVAQHTGDEKKGNGA